MSHKHFISGYKTFDYLVSTPKALRILLLHRRRDDRFQLLLFKAACTLLAVVCGGMCVFSFTPTLLAFGLVAQGVGLFGFLVWLRAGDVFLECALEDEWLFELATERRALSIFEDTERSTPHQGS
jgi:hypothetical protein